MYARWLKQPFKLQAGILKLGNAGYVRQPPVMVIDIWEDEVAPTVAKGRYGDSPAAYVGQRLVILSSSISSDEAVVSKGRIEYQKHVLAIGEISRLIGDVIWIHHSEQIGNRKVEWKWTPRFQQLWSGRCVFAERTENHVQISRSSEDTRAGCPTRSSELTSWLVG